MSRAVSVRIVIGLFVLCGFLLLTSLTYELTVAARWNPALPAEGPSRWALLKLQNSRRDFGALLVAWNHFYPRLLYPPTQVEAIIRALISSGTTIGIGLFFVVMSFVTRKPMPYGNARFGTLLDAEKHRLLAKNGLILGKLSGNTLISNDPSHVLVVGPTRSGKGVSFVIPNGYMWRGSSVWFDPKRENFGAIGAHRQNLGDQVFMFSPGERDTHRYNPLDFIRRDERMATDAAVVASFIVPEGTGSSEIWARSARQLLASLIGVVIASPSFEGQRHLRAVSSLTSTGAELLKVLIALRDSEKSTLPVWVVQGLNQFIALEPETRNSAFFNLVSALNPWTSDLVAAATAASDFDIRLLRKHPIAIFIGCSVAQLDVYRPIIKILIQQIHDVLMVSLPGADEPLQVLMMIDEFRQLGRMDALVSKLTVNAGYGFRMVLILQDLAQLDEVYGKPTRITTVSACQIKLFIRINDLETSSFVSDMLGSTTMELRTPIIRAGQGIFGGQDKSVSYQQRALRTAEELRQMSGDKAIVLAPNAPGFELKKIAHFKDAPYKRIHDALKGKSVKLPILERWQDREVGRAGAEVQKEEQVEALAEEAGHADQDQKFGVPQQATIALARLTPSAALPALSETSEPVARSSNVVIELEVSTHEAAQSENEIMLPPERNRNNQIEPTSINLTSLAGLCDDDIIKLVEELALEEGKTPLATAGVAGLSRKMREFIADKEIQSI